jgi:hypothetical protein
MITTKVLSSNPAHGEVYSKHHYAIKTTTAIGATAVGTTVLITQTAGNYDY